MSPRSPAMLLATLLSSLAGSALAAEAATMKAIRYDAYGPASVMQYVDVPRPQAGAGEVLLRVRAAGVNPIDWKIRNGTMARYSRGLPATPGYDLSGDIVALGQGVQGFEPGEAVFARLDKPGAYAEYVAIPASQLARKPAQVSYAAAAAVPTAALTAHQALFGDGRLQRGQTVLIHAAAGGVGHFAVQLAKQAGARVIGTASAANREFLLGLGADVAVDYRSERFEDAAKEVDLVLDAVGGDTLERSYGVIGKGGTLVSIVARLDPAKLEAHGIRAGAGRGESDSTVLGHLAAMMEAGALKVEIDETFPLSQAVRAHERSETGHARGKIVLLMDAPTP